MILPTLGVQIQLRVSNYYRVASKGPSGDVQGCTRSIGVSLIDFTKRYPDLTGYACLYRE